MQKENSVKAELALLRRAFSQIDRLLGFLFTPFDLDCHDGEEEHEKAQWMVPLGKQSTKNLPPPQRTEEKESGKRFCLLLPQNKH